MATQRQQSRNGQQQQSKAKPPVHEIRISRLRVSIWEQQSDKGAWHSCTLTRSYKDAQGAWKTATSYGKDDLLVAGELLRQAFLWIAREHGGAASNVSGGTDNNEQSNGNGNGGEY